jgi:hypothetical protein
MPFDRGQTDAAWSQPGEAGHFMFLFNEHRLAHLKQPQSTQQLEWPLYRIDFGPMLRSKAAIRFRRELGHLLSRCLADHAAAGVE